MKKITIRQAILDAIDETDDTIARHMNTLLKWAKYCEKAIGSVNGYPFKSALFTVNQGEITMPDDCYTCCMIVPGDYTSEINLRYIDQKLVMVNVEDFLDFTPHDLEMHDVEFIWSDLSYKVIPKALWEEIGDKVNLIDQYEGQQVTMVYQYIQTDDKGYWLVNESHMEAIKKHLIYMISKKYLYSSFRAGRMTRNNDMQMVQSYKIDRDQSIRNARALDNQENPINTADRQY
jgi:hypothetical protein